MIDAISAAAYIVFLREGIEAILIVAIITAYLTKLKVEEGKKYVALGVGGAIISSMILATVFFSLSMAFEGVAEKLFEGIVSIVATVILTYMIFWMAKNAKNIKSDLETQLSKRLSEGSLIGISLVVFFAVFREGLETVLFFSVIFTVNPVSMMIGTILGFFTLLIVAYIMLYTGIRLPLQKFFKYTAIILIVFASGILGYGIHELIEALEIMGYELGFLAKPIWDISHIISESSMLGQFLKGLIGYDANPELLRIIVYSGYWALTLYAIREIILVNTKKKL